MAYIYEDGPQADYESNPTDVAIRKIKVSADDVLSASLIKSGGQAVRLVPITKSN